MPSTGTVTVGEVITALSGLGGEADSSEIKERVISNRGGGLPSRYTYWESYRNTIDQVIHHYCRQCKKFLHGDAHFQQISPGRYRLAGSRKEAADYSSRPKNVRAGAGFGDPENNRKVERAAIDAARTYYKSHGWKVQSAEAAKRGFDLLCTKGSKSKHVEVKGIAGNVESFVITAREVTQAKNDRQFVLCTVGLALSKNPHLTRYAGEDFIREFTLEPSAFHATRRRRI